MGKVFAFHGGIHPPENKKQSTRTPIRKAPLPKLLYLPLQQHIGMAASPLVNIGDRVLKGQMIAEPVGRISASLHAPTSGIIRSIGPHPVPHASGLESDCIVIESDGQDEWIEHQSIEDYTKLEPGTLIEHIRRCGIAGMGGAGFPTDVKLHLGDDHIVNTLIINAAECEPYITADDMLMRERAHEILGGIRIISHLLKPSHIMIGIEDNKSHAIHTLEQVLKGCELNIDIRVVPTKYPSGGERQLIKLLTDIEVPSGRIPADIGIVCQNIGTTTAIYRAVHHGEPLISRVVTVTGDAVAQPQNLEALIGTPFADLLDAANVYENKLYRLVMGGPMMGVTVEHDQIPVIKTTNCIIAATIDEMPPAPPEQACIRCGMCEQVCPAELLPQQLYWFSKGREFDKARHHNLFDCIECGACAYVCPSSIPLVQYYRFAKSEIRTEEAEQRKADHARQRFEARQARLEREEAEKEARRKARAEEAARAQQARKNNENAAATAEPAQDISALKTAAAVARTKLKKAQKALDAARESGEGDISALEAAVQAAQTSADQAQKALDSADKPSAPTAPAAGADIKQLKTAAAVARTKLKKARDALKNAEDKGLDGLDKLRATLSTLEQKAEEADKAFKDAENAASSSTEATPAAPVDMKALKQQVSIMRTKLKKAEAALEGLEGDERSQAEQALEELRQRHAEADQAFKAAEQAQIDAAAAQGVDLKQLKIDAAMARAAVTKLERALAKTEEEQERASLEAELVTARDKAEQLNKTLQQHEPA
ncbi:electron transport complex subunit RsxC [Marinobacterium sediminicola]|uniref:Ion-translocating oxidoreductase complex subunit C n=1 Tax=Marinobacterium sediminicola TaxID=518898 RepID=A0ABY1RWM8_9GAMM|nr:electron transport complex subunit RsxC [Marinobacterium sediminicola]ULG70308.1 electron transport complex subunit RsxC [Marinobacterium sediminicola]SMR69777.1 electron transport complex protein RnfC [Marinobacterium sediminicola]